MPGPIQSLGFGLGGYGTLKWLVFGYPLDSSVLTLAAALIIWRAPARAQERRNARRRNGSEDDGS